ncbi:anthrone oxygenase family protein [Sphingomonas phyllosphaerae]|uniref:anthrone oxygenase family protein n=1 Tax=Sphingomonas phyllosphaerae TaxID=257003 RepID=UPI0003B2F997|nr:anthrone oxygenase family protein [Sphingomonas phyllosphaerae]
MANRETITRAFLWLAVLVGGPLLGAKLFDLVVLAGAWGADPPASLAMMPYGKAWPVDTGVFFIPFSAAMLIAGFGALVAGWRTPWRYRWQLCLPSIGILLLLILTVVAFWPMNAALYYHGIGSSKDTITDPQSVAMAKRWVTLDWVRVAGAAVAFVAPLRALTLPWPRETTPEDPPLVRAILACALLGVVAFVVWFVSNL